MTMRELRDIEWIVEWALVDNGLGRLFVDNLTRVNWMALGTRVSGGSGGWSIGAPGIRSADAVTVAAAIEALPADPVNGERTMTALVVRFGRVGDRPDWCEEGPGKWEQASDARGRLLWDWEKPNNRSATRGARRPRIQFIGETESAVAFYRAQYALWRGGLVALQAALTDRLEALQPTGPLAPAAPWLVPQPVDQEGKVVDLGGRSAARLVALKHRGPIRYEPPVTETEVSESASGGGALRRA